MTPYVSRLSYIFTIAIVLATAVLLGTNRLEYCGQPEAQRREINATCAAETRGPTLAPPQKIVFVRIVADKPDLEIGWAEN